MTPEDLVSRLLYRDGLMLVIDKPPGIAVHAGPKGGLTLDALFEALRFGLPNAPQLAHRLDRETSGCLVLGRHRKALAKIGRLFAEGRVEKTYVAVLRGRPPAASGRVALPLAKRSATRGWWMRVDRDNGQRAETEYRILGEAQGLTLAELKPLTGRTHQLRVHMAEIGCPILGERIYASAPPPPAGPLLHLHARALAAPLYPNRDAVRVTAPFPAHMTDSFGALGFDTEEVDGAMEPT